MKKEKQIAWINAVKGFAMLLILFFHTDVYFANESILPYSLYVSNSILLFFSVTGYLFYRAEGIDFKKKIKSISLRLLLPYILFTIILYVPKTIAHKEHFDVSQLFQQILLGKAYWFIAALIVGQIIFIILIRYIKKVYLLFIISLLCFIVSTLKTTQSLNYIWFWQSGLMSVYYICLGYLVNKYNLLSIRYINNYYIVFLCIIAIILKYIEQLYGHRCIVAPVIISEPLFFIVETTIINFLTLYLFSKIKSYAVLEYIGKNSIIYYLFCGAVPMAVSLFFNRLNLTYNHNIIYILPVMLLVIALCSVFSFIINKYFSFLIGGAQKI